MHLKRDFLRDQNSALNMEVKSIKRKKITANAKCLEWYTKIFSSIFRKYFHTLNFKGEFCFLFEDFFYL